MAAAALPSSQRVLAWVLGGALVALIVVVVLLQPLWAAVAVVVLALATGAACLASLRWLLAAPADEALDPEVSDSARDRATFRVLRTSTAAAVVALGASVVAVPTTGVVWVIALLVAAAGAGLALLRPPRLALRPDVAADAAPPRTGP